MSMKKLNILIVDDEPIIHEAFITSFENEITSGQVDMSFCLNGQECLEVLLKDPKKYKGGVIIADLNMPKMDGFQLLEYIKEKHSELSISVVSAYASEEYKKLAKEKGASNYYIKPLDVYKIRSSILKKYLT